jgi:hypothetical protein
MKKSKALIVCLIGLSVAIGLALIACSDGIYHWWSCTCGKHMREEKEEGRWVEKEHDYGKCKGLFCARNWNPEKECNCLVDMNR